MPTHYRGTPREVAALNALIPLMRAASSLGTALSRRLERKKLTLGQFGVLEALLHLGPMCQRELAEKLLVSGGNMTFVIDNLEKRRLVRRVRDLRDRRVAHIELTDSGDRLIRRIFPAHAADIARLLSVMTRDEFEMLRRLCGKLGRDVSRRATGQNETRRKSQ